MLYIPISFLFCRFEFECMYKSMYKDGGNYIYGKENEAFQNNNVPFILRAITFGE